MNPQAMGLGRTDCLELEDDHGVIRSVARALKLLTLLNQNYALSLHDLHGMSGLPKPTVFRILSTLQAEGYVEFEGRQGFYRIGAKVCELSSGYSDSAVLADLCRPVLMTTTQASKWPLALGVLDGLEMVVRVSTMPQSPMAVAPSTQGKRYNLLRSALGAAHLAFCAESERALLLDLALEEADDPQAEAQIRRRIADAQRRGYALRMPQAPGDTGTAALPIRSGGSVIGVLSLTTFGSVMSEAFVDGQRSVLDSVVSSVERAFELRLRAPPQSVAFLRQTPAPGRTSPFAKAARS